MQQNKKNASGRQDFSSRHPEAFFAVSFLYAPVCSQTRLFYSDKYTFRSSAAFFWRLSLQPSR